MKYFVFVILFFNFFIAYAEGKQDPYAPFEDYIQIKVINKTTSDIEFYIRQYYFPEIIKSNEYYLTKQIRENYKESCFFMIKYGDGRLVIYNFNDTDHWGAILYQFHITVFDDCIRIFESPFDKEYDYDDVNIYDDYYTKSLWRIWEWNKEDKNVNIINNSDNDISVYIYDAYSELKQYFLKPGDETYFIENQTLFQLRPIEILENSKFELFENFEIFIYHKWFDYKNIYVIFKNKGYEVLYE
jgi:hypothetical protein